jgi:hypothetical protein
MNRILVKNTLYFEQMSEKFMRKEILNKNTRKKYNNAIKIRLKLTSNLIT